MRKKKEAERGLLSLEACISVTIFLFFMLFLYSFFIVFEARNEMAHVVLATTDSMSLDVYENSKIEKSGDLAQVISAIYNLGSMNEDGFVSSELWNEVKKWDVEESEWDGTISVPSGNFGDKPDEFGKKSAVSSLFAQVIRERFIAYLAGGDEAEANKLLKRYHIVGGVDGLDFSGSCIKSNKLYIKVKYTLEYEFNMFGLGTVEMEHSACSRIWK